MYLMYSHRTLFLTGPTSFGTTSRITVRSNSHRRWNLCTVTSGASKNQIKNATIIGNMCMCHVVYQLNILPLAMSEDKLGQMTAFKLVLEVEE